MDLEGIIFVVFVSLLIITLLTTYIWIFMQSLFYHFTTIFFIYFPIYIVVAILLFVSYYRAVCSVPGYTQEDDNHQFTQLQMEKFRGNMMKHRERKEKKKVVLSGFDPQQMEQIKQHSFCERCNAVKPPRSHHCKACKRCILRMDHHCPWVGNCVGVLNHKYFILFLFYATLGLILNWSTIFIDSYNDWPIVSPLKEQKIPRYIMIANGFVSLFLSVSIGFLFVTQLIGVADNVTTIQSFVPGINELPFRKDTCGENFRQYFGESYWMLPIDPQLKRKY